MKYLWMYLGILGANLLLAYGVYFLMPEMQSKLMVEDGLIENLSALFYFISFVAGMWIFVKTQKFRIGILLTSIVGLVGFLDEISFGERWFAFEMPTILGVKIDAVHDVFYLVAITVDKAPRSYAVLFIIICLGLLIAGGMRYGPRILRMILSTYPRSTVIIAALFFAQILISLIIDLELVRNDLLFVLEEQLEMNAAISLLFCCLSMYVVDAENSDRKPLI